MCGALSNCTQVKACTLHANKAVILDALDRQHEAYYEFTQVTVLAVAVTATNNCGRRWIWIHQTAAVQVYTHATWLCGLVTHEGRCCRFVSL